MPALPRIRQDHGPSASQEAPIAVVPTPEVAALVPQLEEPAQDDIPSIPEPPAAQEPIQVAKVMPQEPEQTEMITETLEAALSDIYFDYDRFTIREDAAQALKANAELLAEKLAEKKIVIEGHCDARGTQSYNMVLGEARSNAVKSFLQDLGISGEKLRVVSYGKDKPFCMEHTEECFQENRRGHFVIK
jgi:peptidoglycan-associated lipoprotein